MPESFHRNQPTNIRLSTNTTIRHIPPAKPQHRNPLSCRANNINNRRVPPSRGGGHGARSLFDDPKLLDNRLHNLRNVFGRMLGTGRGGGRSRGVEELVRGETLNFCLAGAAKFHQ